MHAEVVPDDDLTGTQGRGEDLIDEDLEARPIGRALQRHCGRDAGQVHGRKERGVRALVTRHRADHALPTWSPPIAPRHRKVGPALIDKDQRRGIEALGLLPPGGADRLTPLGRVQDFF
jgi:hypothetical protein